MPKARVKARRGGRYSVPWRAACPTEAQRFKPLSRRHGVAGSRDRGVARRPETAGGCGQAMTTCPILMVLYAAKGRTASYVAEAGASMASTAVQRTAAAPTHLPRAATSGSASTGNYRLTALPRHSSRNSHFSGTGGRPAAHVQPRRNNSPTAGLRIALASWPRGLWKTRPWP